MNNDISIEFTLRTEGYFGVGNGVGGRSGGADLVGKALVSFSFFLLVFRFYGIVSFPEFPCRIRSLQGLKMRDFAFTVAFD